MSDKCIRIVIQCVIEKPLISKTAFWKNELCAKFVEAYFIITEWELKGKMSQALKWWNLQWGLGVGRSQNWSVWGRDQNRDRWGDGRARMVIIQGMTMYMERAREGLSNPFSSLAGGPPNSLWPKSRYQFKVLYARTSKPRETNIGLC